MSCDNTDQNAQRFLAPPFFNVDVELPPGGSPGDVLVRAPDTSPYALEWATFVPPEDLVTGPPGQDGLSAYQIAVAQGFVGTAEEWIASLEGTPGAPGANGQGVPTGGKVGQVLRKSGTNDFATFWDYDTKGEGRTTPQSSYVTTSRSTGYLYFTKVDEVVTAKYYRLFAMLEVINTTTASNLILEVVLSDTTILTLTVPLGTTANASPGRLVRVEAIVNVINTTQAEATIEARAVGPVAFDTFTATQATQTYTTSAFRTVGLYFSTSAASSQVRARTAFIEPIT